MSKRGDLRPPCLSCLGRLGRQDPGDTHTRCLRRLFGQGRKPTLDLDLADLNLVGLTMVGRTSISGVQSKLALGLHDNTLSTEFAPTRFILKPQEREFDHLPENEHLTMLLAAGAGLGVPPLTLVRMQDGSLALLERRFDRAADGHKLPMEDLCQLSELLPADKYSGSAEGCARLIRRYSASPPLDLRTLFLQFLFSWWVGNGDLHLKNLSLLSAKPNEPRLSPVYDLVNMRLYIPQDDMALSVSGKRSNLKLKSWVSLADTCLLPRKAAAAVVAKLLGGMPEASTTIEASFLPSTMKDAYASALRERSELLAGLVPALMA